MKVSHQTKKEEILNFREQLKEIGIKLDLSQSLFYENGKLKSLYFMVQLPDGSYATAGADQVKLQYNYVGFEYNLTGKSKLKAGVLEK